MSIFYDEWRDSLREHYKYIIRIKDTVTLKSLRGQMHELGFSEVELKELEVLAFVRAEDAPEDFVPDLDALRDEPRVFPSVEMVDQDDEPQMIDAEQSAEIEDDDTPDDTPPANSQQLSLF